MEFDRCNGRDSMLLAGPIVFFLAELTSIFGALRMLSELALCL
jgi:hypothetical protein